MCSVAAHVRCIIQGNRSINRSTVDLYLHKCCILFDACNHYNAVINTAVNSDAAATTCINKTELAGLLTQLSTAVESNVTTVSDRWNIGGSIFFAMTVVSTIG